VSTQPFLDIFLETKIDTADDECITGMGRHRKVLYRIDTRLMYLFRFIEQAHFTSLS
jgi:hypothetical protein